MTDGFSERKKQLEKLVKKLSLDKIKGIREIDYDLLDTALRHPSYCMEHADVKKNLPSNQRLEFLGDSVLGLVTAKKIYLKYPSYGEGKLTKIRAGLVCEKSLAAAATIMGLGEYLVMGRGIAASGGAHQASILADAFESVLGALYLNGATLKALEEYIFAYVDENSENLDHGMIQDYKGGLQAFIQKEKGHILKYSIMDEKGPDHKKMFLAAVYLDGREIGRGWGKTKQEAEKQAAKLGLYKLQKEE